MFTQFKAAAFGLVLCLSHPLVGSADARAESSSDPRYQFDIGDLGLSQALRDYGQICGQEIIFTEDLVTGRKTPKVRGNLTAAAALEQLLKGSGLTAERSPSGALMIKRLQPVASGVASMEGDRRKLAQASNEDERGSSPAAMEEESNVPGPSSQELERSTFNIPEILVIGSRTFNVDIERTEDDPQPYVVFGAEEIKRSPATNLQEFLKTRLPMNAVQSNVSQTSTGLRNNTPGLNFSQVDLRGLGANQTLILVDGRRMPGVSIKGGLLQPDLNGIPLSAIERIEVLPSTASGIYGGGATGGVVNIILKRRYSGLEVEAAYGDTFEGDVASRRVDVNAGITLEDGRINISIAASHSDEGELLVGERDFGARARARALANNPAAVVGPLGNIPPAGSTPNIGSAFGGNLTLDAAYGGTNLGSNHTYIPLGYAGPASDNAAALVANAGQYNFDLPNDLNGRQGALITSPTIDSLTLNARRQFSGRIEAYLTLSSFNNKGEAFTTGGPTSLNFLAPNAPNNPFQQFIFVSAPAPGLEFPARSSLETLQGVAGVIVRLPHNWAATVDYDWSRSRLEATSKAIGGVTDDAAFVAVQTGLPAPDGRPSLNILQETNTFPLDYGPYILPDGHEGPTDTILKDASLRFSGPVFDVWGGPLTASALIGHRDETLERSILRAYDSDTREPIYRYDPSVSVQADSLQLELSVPLISATNAMRFARALELQASVRHDDYEVTGVPFGNREILSPDGPFPDEQFSTNHLRSTDYMLALRFKPVPALALRTSFGTGFLPPSINQVASSIGPDTRFGAADPKRGNVVTVTIPTYTRLTGGSTYLKPEQSESWSAGIVLTPPLTPGLRFSVDYTRIRKTDEIGGVSVIFLLANEDNLPGRILRAPLTDADRALGFTGGVITQIDNTLINLARTRVEAYDFQLDYAVDTKALGSFHFYTVGTWQPSYENQTLPTSALVDYISFADGPLEWRGNAGVTWQRGPWTLGWNTQYYDSYSVLFAEPFAALISNERNVLSQGSTTIQRQIYHDFSAGYRFDSSSTFAGGLLANTDILLSVQNVFDTSPPILAGTNLFGGYSFYGDPRLRRFTMSLTKSFGRR